MILIYKEKMNLKIVTILNLIINDYKTLSNSF